MKPKKAKRCISLQASGERAMIYYVMSPKVVALFTSLLQNDSIIFDIGSWIGI